MKQKSKKLRFAVKAKYTLDFFVTVSAEGPDEAKMMASNQLASWLVELSQLSEADLHPAFGSNVIENIKTSILSCAQWNDNEWLAVSSELFPMELVS